MCFVVDCEILINLQYKSVCTLYPSVGSVVVLVVNPVLFLAGAVFVAVVLGVGTECVVYYV